MKVLFISTSDIEGGAARAAYRVHCGMPNVGVDSRMLVLKKVSDNPAIEQPEGVFGKALRALNWRLDSLPLKLYPRRDKNTFWSLNWEPFPLMHWIESHPADLYHFHWVGGGYLPISLIGRLDKPIVWTLHDEWAYTGGCHYSDSCSRYQDTCGRCPQLASKYDYDLSRFTWERKSHAYSQVDITVVTPSHWLAARASQSSLFKDRSYRGDSQRA